MKVRDLVLISLLSASLTAGKMALSFIPNVEIVTLLFMVYTITLGLKRTMVVAVIFATTEIFLYGFNTWVLAYYFVWPALIVGTHLASKAFSSEYSFAILAAVFGASFGFLFAVFESFFYGIATELPIGYGEFPLISFMGDRIM